MGYVGLVTGACLANIGHEVTRVDKHGERVAELKKGRRPNIDHPRTVPPNRANSFVTSQIPQKPPEFSTGLRNRILKCHPQMVLATGLRETLKLF